jgi:hypothetical protein
MSSRLGSRADGRRVLTDCGYRNFVDLWKDADPELQGRVAVAREALARLER